MSGGGEGLPVLAIIAAVAENGVIGRDNDLPWRLSADLQRFKRLTSGHTVIMGRRTYESMGRPLPNRRNVVLSSRADFRPAGVEVVASLEKALARADDDSLAFILGGHQVFAEALPRTDRLYITWVHADVEGEVRFPAIDLGEWQLVESTRHAADDRNEYDYTFADYIRAPSTRP